MAAAAATSPETALSGAGGPERDEDEFEDVEEEEEEECRICRLPAEADRPLRHPCACRGSIRFVHDDCLLRWLATRQKLRCEVCKRDISTRPLYASDAPAKLPISEFMLGLPNKLLGLLPILFAIYVVRDFVIHLTTLWAWRLAFATTLPQVHYLFSLRLTTTSIPALFVLWIALAHRVAPFALGPFARWIARLETRHARLSSIDDFQVLALRTVEGFIMVFIADITIAFVVGFMPFSMGRTILLCFGLGNLDEADSHTTTSILLTGYGFIFSGAVAFAGMNTFCQYLRGERLMLAIFFRWLLGIFVGGIADLITVANICLNLLTAVIIYPLFFGWLLDICTSKMFGATMPLRFASSFISIALHWYIGLFFFKLGSRLFRPFCQILRPRVVFPCVCQDIFAPFCKFHSKKLRSLFVGVIFMIMVIFIPLEIANRLVPELFPLDITYFRRDTDDGSFWQAPQDYADSVFGLLLLRFFICHTQTLLYLEWSVKKIMQYSFVTIWPDGASGHEVGSSVAPKDQYGSTDEAKDKWRLVALNVALVWLTLVIFNVAMLTLPISVGRILLSTISRLPFAGSLKSNDLFALVVGFGIMSTIIAAFRDSFAYMTSGRTHMLSLKRSLIMFLWLVIIPFLMGLLVDLSLISPFAGRDNEDRVLDFFYSWFLGQHLLRVWLGLVHRSRTIPFLVYFIGERWDSKLTEAKANWISGVISVCWFFQHLLMPMATKLLTMLVVPYVFAKGLFPSFGYSAAVNTAVYRFIWLGNLTFYVLCYLSKVFYAILHDSIRDDLYIIGQRLEDVTG